MNPVHIFLRLLSMLGGGMAITLLAVSAQGPTPLTVHFPVTETR